LLPKDTPDTPQSHIVEKGGGAVCEKKFKEESIFI